MLKISVITPSFNQGNYLEACLLSIKAQNYPNLEHIVVDGLSRDNSIDILKAYATKVGWEHLRWISESDTGQTEAVNKGLRMATGDILAYLCADDLYEPDTFFFVDTFFRENPDVDFIYGGCTFLDDAGKPVRFKKAEPFSHQELLRRNFIWQPTVFLRDRVWHDVGPFNESLNYAMDYEYWLRAATTCKIQSVDRKLAMYRWQNDSKTVSREREQLDEGYRVACAFGGGGPRSWYLYKLYYPNTSRVKRWLFSQASETNLFK